MGFHSGKSSVSLEQIAATVQDVLMHICHGGLFLTDFWAIFWGIFLHFFAFFAHETHGLGMG